MKILPNGIAVIEGDRNASTWVEECGRLDYDRTVDVLLPLINTGDIVIDVGALIGGFSVAFKNKVGESGIVHAFEPNPDAYNCLVHNCPNVVCHPCALGKYSGVLTFNHDQHNPGASWLGKGDGVYVQVYRLDEVARTLGGFSSLKLIKMDVEGMEPDVIAGATAVISSMRPIIMAEINHGALSRNGYTHEDVSKPLIDIGYKMQFISPEHSMDFRKFPQLDVLFMP